VLGMASNRLVALATTRGGAVRGGGGGRGGGDNRSGSSK
jgi:hypothetical protein